MEDLDAVATAVVCIVGALGFLALHVYPFQYGWVESALLAGGFVAVTLVEVVLDTAFA